MRSTCVLDPGPERLAVAEAGVDRVLEVRVRVDEAGHDRRVGVVALGAARRHLDDPAALEAHEPALDRRPVDGQHPVGRDSSVHVLAAHVVPAAAVARAARRSSSTESQIDSLVEEDQRDRLEEGRHRVDARQRDADAGDDEVADAPVPAELARC